MNFNLSNITPLAKSLSALSLLCLVSTASAQFGYSTAFEVSEGYTPGSLSGSPTTGIQWDTSDAPPPTLANNFGFHAATAEFIGQADSVGPLQGDADNFQAAIGGRGTALPGADQIFLFRPFDLSGLDRLAFDVDFGITKSSVSRPGNDTFGWRLIDAGNATQGIINFVPVTATQLNIVSSFGGSTPTAVGAISYGSNYHLSVNISPTGIVSLTVGPVAGAGTQLVNFQSTVTNPQGITRIAATQTLATPVTTAADGSKTSAGSNQMIFDNYSVVPEPSTVGLSVIAGLGGAIAMFRRRNKAA